ncbi:hypothetical protein AB9N12_04510 [Bacteroides sp. AN502(2024)]|uniref:hypothetical protein n=1 Tax=Bacteroides sp. AN502(2024) TaxID=3160599 RepID=UPI0035189710
MENKKTSKGIDSEEFTPMNTELSEFFVEELEQRLETDPLIAGGLLDLFSMTEEQIGTNPLGSDYCGVYSVCDSYW